MRTSGLRKWIFKTNLKKVMVSWVALFVLGAAHAELRVGLVLEKSGKDDNSFNASAYRGLKRAEQELGVKVKSVESPDNASYEALHRSFAEKKFDLIIGVGFHQVDAIRKIAERFPEQKIVLIDEDAKRPNVRSILFEEHQGSFLVGALAAMKSKSGTVGFIGGMDVPLIRRFQMGYEAGAKAVKANVKILSNYLGVTGDAWNNPPKAKEQALSQYQQGADVIFVAAGNSSTGVFDAAAAAGKFAIGVDSNQNGMKPGFVLTSMIKAVDVAIFEAIKSLKDGTFQGGLVRLGLKEKGVDYIMDQHNKSLISEEQKSKLELFRKEMIEGKRVVPDYYLKNKK